ncbi:MAG: hypothetical protein IH596_11260 [Bacteroidales bacterium]|nr:hypothetical protein [Bacteroidales bacterium]
MRYYLFSLFLINGLTEKYNTYESMEACSIDTPVDPIPGRGSLRPFGIRMAT